MLFSLYKLYLALLQSILDVWKYFTNSSTVLPFIFPANVDKWSYVLWCVVYKTPNLHNWTSVNQLFQAHLASSKRLEIWQTLPFTNKLWNENNFEYGSSAKFFTIYLKVNNGLWVTEIDTFIRATPLLLLLIPYLFYSVAPKISDKMHHKTLTHQLLQSLVHIINDEIQRKERNIWQKHYCNTNLKLPLQQWISHRINVEILK